MIAITSEVMLFLKEQYLKHHPFEACGVLLGPDDVATIAVEMKNDAATPEQNYQFDPTEQLAIWHDAFKDGNKIIGIYHSHTRPGRTTTPSAVDIKYANSSIAHYVIMTENDIDSWSIGGGAYLSEEISIRPI
jgi:proteasome lid subunit RPN8/RPN11